MDARAEKIALFRYALIAPLVLETLPRGELTRRAEEIAARHYEIPYSQRTSLSVDTLLDWALRYRRRGLPWLGSSAVILAKYRLGSQISETVAENVAAVFAALSPLE